MRHLFGKEHKEQKSMKLVKKLQLEEDQKWQEELQRRLEQEEKDAAFARELQEQIASDNTTNTSSPTANSPITIVPNTSSPPPLPVKPTAYHSSGPSSTSSNSNSNHIEQQRTRPLVSPLSPNSAPSSTSSLPQRDTPPPPYQNGQPRLPPRERTVSQVSQYIPSTPNLSSNNNVGNNNNNNNNNSNISASAPPPPSTMRPSQHQHHSAYLPALNTAVTPGIGHQTLNPRPYYPATPQIQPQLYPPSTTPQQQQSTTFQPPRRDPAMLIIPPRKEKQPATVAQSDPVYTTMPMPEPVRSTTPFNPYSTPSSYSSSFHLTSTPMAAGSSSSSLLLSSSTPAPAPAPAPVPTPIVLSPKPPPVIQQVHTPTPPPITALNSYHSLPVGNTMSNSNGKQSVTPISQKKTSSLPVITHTSQPVATKPDTKLGIMNSSGSSFTTPHQNIKTMGNTIDQEDSDEDEPLFWERKDGRMMSNTPSIKPKTLTPPPKQQQQQQHNYHEKHMVATRDDNEEYDSEAGSAVDSDDDEEDDQAIDLFNIRASDNVIIMQHNQSTHSSYDNKGKTESHEHYQDNSDNLTKGNDSHDPFADRFAVLDVNNRGSNKSETTPATHERSRSASVMDAKPAFQMNTKSSTIAKVHDPLLMMASKGGSGAGASSSPATTYASRPSRPTSTLPWNSSHFAASSIPLTSSTPPSSFGTPIGSTIPRPASVYQHPFHQVKNNNDDDDDDDLITLDSDDIQPVAPTNVLRAGAPPNIQSMISEMTAEVPSNEFGYYQYQTDKPGGEKEEIEEAVVKVLPKLPKSDPDHRHITVPSVIEDQRVWIRVHPTDTGKSLASRIQIVATYKTRKILSITTDKGRAIALDETPVFQDWAGVMQMEDGAPWKVEWTVLDHHLWEGPKEFLRYLKASLRS